MRQQFTPLFLVFLTLLSVAGLSQPATGDPDPTRWLNYTQTYYKIPITEPGIYQLSAIALRQANVPIDIIRPTTLQLFHRGVEQAIYVSGESDGHFDENDFIEFYGLGNDGVADSLLYRPHSAHNQPYYSLFSDTTAYFLTWRLDGKPGRRMSTDTDTALNELVPDTYHWAEERQRFTEDYPGWPNGLSPKIEYSYYEAGEGYTGLVQQKDKPLTRSFSLVNANRAGPSPTLDLLLVGRDVTNHRVDCWVGPQPDKLRLLDSIRFSGYDNGTIRQALNWSDVGADNNTFITLISRGENTSSDAYSLSYASLRYSQTFQLRDQQQVFQLVANPLSRSLIQFDTPATDTRFWDITDTDRPIRINRQPSGANARLLVLNTTTARTLFSTNQLKAVPSIRPVTFIDRSGRTPTYVIITHEALMQPVYDPLASQPINAVRAYSSYRASAAGGGHDTLTVTMQQLIDQYNYGERSPLAIRRFVSQLYRQGNGSVRYLLLLGRSRSTPGIRRNPAQSTLDMVMTGGYPGSDIVFSSGLDGPASLANTPNVPAIPTGRINAGTPHEVIGYLNKVKEYEQPTDKLTWRKNLRLLSGGQSPGERDLFRRLVDQYGAQAEKEFLGAHVETIGKTTDDALESIDLTSPVNEGVGLLTFFGHSGLAVTDLAIGFCSDDALGYHNKGKYPLLLVNGCAIGNFFFGRPTLATDWVLTPNRGAIAAIAHSHLGQPDVMHQYTTTFFSLLTDSTQLNRSIGELQQETIRRVLVQSTDGRALANCQQMVLQGDPAVRLFPFKTPDYAVTSGGLTIVQPSGQPLTSLSDSVQVRVVCQNAGLYRQHPLAVRIRRWINEAASGVFNFVRPRSIPYQDTLTFTFPNERNAVGINRFEVTINPADSPLATAELNQANNQASIELPLPSSKPVLIYPALNSFVRTTTVRLTALYETTTPQLFDLELDSTTRFDSPICVKQRLTASGVISSVATLPVRPRTTCYWRVRIAGLTAPTDQNAWSVSSFVYAPDDPATGMPEGQLWLRAPLPTDSQQGDRVLLAAEFSNLSPYPFADSLVVQQTIYAAGLTNAQTLTWRVKAPVGTDTLHLTSRVDTKNLPGMNRVVLTVNPRFQPEYSFLNNTLDLSLPVRPDRLGPLLEVAVDGERITEGATVSAHPVIDILVADENRSLLRRDTTGLDLYLKNESAGTPFKWLPWRGAIMQPTGPDNLFRLRYPPLSLSEGSYQMLVTARDEVGNAANPYQVRFRVISQPTLTDLVVYPNPLRDQTAFRFQLTGNEPPANVTIRLTTLTGKLVKQLTRPARIGLNEWIWDGRDIDGNPLPSGIYLYKLTLLASNGLDWPVNPGLAKYPVGRLLLIR